MPAGGGRNRGAGDAMPMHVVMPPWLAFGHIVPFTQLARRLLASSSSVRVTFLTAAGNVPRVEAMLSPPPSSASSAGGVTIVPLRLPRVPGLPEGAASTADLSPEGAELLKVALDAARPQVAALLAELRPDAVLLDFATTSASEDAAALGIKSLRFSVFSAITGAYLVVPTRCPDVSRPSARDLMSAPAGFPGSSPLATTGIPAYQAAEFTYMFTSFGGQPCAYDRAVAGIRACDGIVIKTCAEMEGAYINYLAAQLQKPFLVAGPLVPDPPQGELDERWASWLSAFPDGAVVFASFGSETFLPPVTATELLLGLEATGLPFLAVLNSPDGAEAIVPPPGIAERVAGRGVVCSGWVQQQHILRHDGFSSVVEGLVAGCRLVLLPMKGGQYLNAALFARELRVGVEVARRDEDGWFGRQDVCDAVAAAVADGGGGDARKWADFLTDEGVQGWFADEFVRQLGELVSAASS